VEEDGIAGAALVVSARERGGAPVTRYLDISAYRVVVITCRPQLHLVCRVEYWLEVKG
jgi:hypothetical protein